MKARVSLLASLFSLCLVAVVAAQVSTTTGTVVSNSGGVLVVDTDSGQRTFMVDAQSSLPADLATGARVTVEYHTLANDKFHAFKVTTLGTSPTSPATAATTDTTMAPPAETTTAPAPAAPTMAAPTPAPTTTTSGNTMQEQTPATTPTDSTTTRTTTTRSTMDDDSSTTGGRLPSTASPLPLLALAGSLALAGGVLLRRRRA